MSAYYYSPRSLMRLTTRKPIAVLVKQGRSRNIILRDMHRCKTDLVDIRPNSNRVTPNSNKVTPSSNRVTQGSSSNRTINGRLVQSLEREIFLHRVYWLYQSYLAGLFTIDSDVGFAHGVDNLYNAAIPFLLRILFF